MVRIHRRGVRITRQRCGVPGRNVPVIELLAMASRCRQRRYGLAGVRTNGSKRQQRTGRCAKRRWSIFFVCTNRTLATNTTVPPHAPAILLRNAAHFFREGACCDENVMTSHEGVRNRIRWRSRRAELARCLSLVLACVVQFEFFVVVGVYHSREGAHRRCRALKLFDSWTSIHLLTTFSQ